MNKQQTKFSIDIETGDLERLRAIAKEEGNRSVGSLLRSIIRKFLKK